MVESFTNCFRPFSSLLPSLPYSSAGLATVKKLVKTTNQPAVCVGFWTAGPSGNHPLSGPSFQYFSPPSIFLSPLSLYAGESISASFLDQWLPALLHGFVWCSPVFSLQRTKFGDFFPRDFSAEMWWDSVGGGGADSQEGGKWFVQDLFLRRNLFHLGGLFF